MKRNININKPEMSSEQIAARRDFGSMQQAYQASGAGGASSGFFSKTIYLASGIAIVALSLTIWYFSANNTEPETIAETTITTQYDGLTVTETASVVHAPMDGLNVTYTKYIVNSTTGDTLDYYTGTKILIPAGAFTNGSGGVVSGDVEIQYREFHDPAEYFAAGIPMTYDSAAVQYHFESAGMMEIVAYQNGQRLNTNPTAPIKVEMRSYNASIEFNLYSLEETTGDWVLKGKDKVVVTGDESNYTDGAPGLEMEVSMVPYLLQEELKKVKGEIIEFKRSKPVAPIRADPKRNRFDVDVSPSEFPEIAVYTGVFFEVSDKNTDFKEEWYEVIWEDVSLKRMTDSLHYEITFTKGKQTVNILVYPVLEGKNYIAAKQQFDDKYTLYKTKLKDKQDEEKRLLAEYEAELKKQKEIWEVQQKYVQNQQLVASAQQDVLRIFTIDKFGFWNCDSPQMWPKGAEIAAVFENAKGERLDFNSVYLMELGRNAAFQYWIGSMKNFKYNPSKQNVVWGITHEGKLAVLKPNQLKALNTHKEVNLAMDVLPEYPTQLNELRAVLGLKEKGAGM